MALTIATNSAALNSQRMLNSSQSSLNKAMERLSSGMRINRAADEGADLGLLFPRNREEAERAPPTPLIRPSAGCCRPGP